MRVARIMPPARILVGLDFSISCPGICITKQGQEEFTHHAIHTPPLARFKYKPDRFHHITEMVMEVLKPIRRNPSNSFIFMEDYAFGAMGKTFDLAECAGLFKWKLNHHWHFPLSNLFFVSISHIKMFGAGKGNVAKAIMLKEVFKRWDFDTSDDNEADAFVLMKIAGSYFESDPNLTSFQKEALSRIRKYNDKGIR